MASNSENSFSVEDVIQQLQAGTAMPAELMEIYTEEADEHLRTIYDGLDRLRANQADMQALGDVRRASHTLKGAAGAVGLQSVTRLAHRMEDLLDQLAELNNVVTDGQLNLLLAAADLLQGLTTGNFDLNDFAQQIVTMYQQLSNELGGAVSNKESRESKPATFKQLESETSPSIELESVPQNNKPNQQFVRVPLERLDALVNLLGEMIVNRSAFEQEMNEFEGRIDDMSSARGRLRDTAQQIEIQNDSRSLTKPSPLDTPDNQWDDPLGLERFGDFYLLEQSLAEADKDVEIMSGEFRKVKSSMELLLRRQQQLVHDAQKGLMRVRMFALNGIVSRFERTVRTVSNQVGKNVKLEVEGGEIELDKTVLDAITDPLMHLIRNAIDHGVESPEIRIQNGKPELATLRLQAINHGTQITIRISDDGGGIKLESVRQKAIEKGLISAEQELSTDELHALIFQPGFSTAAKLTDVSGRGVGMDVVSDAIARLKGSIRVQSHAGIGTTFTIQLPTTLGTARTVVVESSHKTFAIPMQAIKKIHRFDPKLLVQESLEKQETLIELEGATMPLVSLSDHLHLDAKRKPHQRRCPMLILDNGDQTIALTIDRVFGCRDIVIKPLGNHLKNVSGITGVTIVGDGSVVPVLDPSEFGMSNNGLVVSPEQVGVSVPPRANLAMVIDDSISVRRVTENLLEFSGWDVVTAKDGIDALEKLSELANPPDVFLCDLEMPRMNGLELVRQVREQAEFELTPIVMVTSRSSEQHRQKALEAGASEYIVKPFNDQHLIGLISQLVQQAKETVSV